MKSELGREACDDLKEIIHSENVIGMDWKSQLMA